jgi:alpha-beta hydrolase superfamily lysophospholipase
MAETLTTDVREVVIEPEGLVGLLGVPETARGIVIFAHGSGSGRLSPRNNAVAAALRRAGLATLLLDLLTPHEERDRANVFDIELLSERLAIATRWVRGRRETADLRPGYFGASTGAAAALHAAVSPGSDVGAIVSRGGRPDLAMDVLPLVRAPTLLLVGSLDGPVIAMNRRAYNALRSERRLIIIEGAGHLFEEPGTMEQVIRHATAWFKRYLERPAGEP